MGHILDTQLLLPRLAASPDTAPQGDAAQLGARLRQRYAERIVATCHTPARPARYAPLPAGLDPRLVRALSLRGIGQLYSHQAEAVAHALAGRHVVVATPTASGKSLCHHLPAIQAALSRGGKSLYLFPTKALAQDQVADLLELSRVGGLGLRAHTFDGDTPGDARRTVRAAADLVVSNPDMLHRSILPHHAKWATFFENLACVVIDELHTYRGVFGAHMANVLRRLERVLRFYDVRPVFILASATIANPRELAERLIGAPVELVADSGAPQGPREVLLWQPPVVNADLGVRAAPRSQSTRIARHAIRRGLKSIVFANARTEVEVITKYLKDVFDHDPRQPPRVAAYRGGYLPGARRSTEQALRAGQVHAVVATSALELGVDIGSLDVAVVNGYPGTIAATWQRLGRAGRRQQPSLGVVVTSSQPIDQYLARHPELLFGASPEHARIDPDQLLILMDHVRCAAFELPFVAGETFGVEPLPALLDHLASEGVLHREGETWHWIAEGYPAHGVSLRGVTDGNFTVIDITDGRKDVIAEVDASAAAQTLYPGAIYLVQAQPWQVESLDWVGRKAFVRSTQADYYTESIDYTRLKPLSTFEEHAGDGVACRCGEVHVTRRVAGYKKIRYYSHENVGWGDVRLPDHEMVSTALWWQLGDALLDTLFARRTEALEAFLGAGYALHHVAALVSMCELRDLGRAVGDGSGEACAVVGAHGRGQLRNARGDATEGARFRPTLFLYDNYPGGIGLTAPLFDQREALVRRAAELVLACPCAEGCPACVGPILPAPDTRTLAPKAGALRLLDALMGTPGADGPAPAWH